MALLFFLGWHPMQVKSRKKDGNNDGPSEDEDEDDDLIAEDGTLNEIRHNEMLKAIKKKGQFQNKKLTKREKMKLKSKIRKKKMLKDGDENDMPTKREMYNLKKKAGRGGGKDKKKYEQALKLVCNNVLIQLYELLSFCYSFFLSFSLSPGQTPNGVEGDDG